MLERFIRKSEWFEKKQAIETLVEEGRVPAFFPASVGKEERVLIVIPPTGVNTSVDECKVNPGGAWEFFAPNGGPSKGISSIYDLSPRIAEKLKKRKESALEIVKDR